MCTMYKRIEDLCLQKGVSVTEMCRGAGIPRATITELKMERTTQLSTKNLEKLSAYFSVSMESLLGNETKKAPSLSEERVLDEYEKEFLELSKDLPPEMKKSLLTLVRMYVQDKEGK